MAIDYFSRAELDQLVDPRHPLAVLALRIPWAEFEAGLSPAFAHRDRAGSVVEGTHMFGPMVAAIGTGVSNAGRPGLPIHLMVALLYLKHAYNESGESLVERWAQDAYFQFLSAQTYFDPRLPSDPAQINRFRRVLGEAGVAQLLNTTIDAIVFVGAVKTSEVENVLIETTEQNKVIAHPPNSRQLEAARERIGRRAKRAGIQLKQTHEREGKTLRRKPGGYEWASVRAEWDHLLTTTYWLVTQEWVSQFWLSVRQVKHLVTAVRERTPRVPLQSWPHTAGLTALAEAVADADVVFHLAGTNRPPQPRDHEQANAELSRYLCGLLASKARPGTLVLASSTQAGADNPYGRSKRAAEDAVQALAEQSGACVLVFRIPGVFGPGCPAHAHSVVATWCHLLARSQPLQVHEAERIIALVDVYDVVRALTSAGLDAAAVAGFSRCDVGPVFRTSLGELAHRLRNLQSHLQEPALEAGLDALDRRLLATLRWHQSSGAPQSDQPAFFANRNTA